MSPDAIRSEIAELCDKGKALREKGAYPSHVVDTTLEIQFLSEAERERLHQLKLSLPKESSAEIKARIMKRRAKRRMGLGLPS